MLVFNPKKMTDLRTGAGCLNEVIKNQVQTIEDAERARRQAIANEKAARTKVRSVWEPDVVVCALSVVPGQERISR